MIKKIIKRTETYKSLENESIHLEKQLNYHKTQKQNIKEEIGKLKSQNKNLEIKKTNLEKERFVLRNEKKQLENQLNYHKTQKQNIKEEMDRLIGQNDIIKKHLNYERSDNKALKGRNNHLENVKKNYISLVENLMAENKSVKDEYAKNIEPSANYNKLTIIIPYRKTDDPDREENLVITLNYLSKIGIKNVIISEHSNNSSKSYLLKRYGSTFDSFTVIFNNSDNNLFNKSYAVNQGVKLLKTPYFGIVDTDCITKKENIDMAIYLLDNGFDLVHPFNRVIKDIVDKEKFTEKYDFKTVESPPQYRKWADGGMVFWKKSSFISIGMQNEIFSGWGGEDNEIIIRANLFGLKNYRIDDVLYHLYHYRPLKMSEVNIEQIKEIKQINTKEELLKQISEWPWVVDNLNHLQPSD
ncbi:glycosyltransferase family 2 protein [Methanobacterium sp. SMA-27]|uniref:glycosyltransferase n=1 Tax=Methanobacterium sp. SMA-27 TaxID=1495336 RepID=UPI00064F999F|nr:galactosyltransferase-related protein [Methanobacterium sp. SMA-27]